MDKTRWVIKIIVGFFILVFLHNNIGAQTRRAVLVGINKYKLNIPFKPTPYRAKPLKGLHGCINDVKAMIGILESRFHFRKENIHILTNENATREGIITSIEKYLIQEALPGDICVFYFSGHGSWITNLKSTEWDKKDETLVPFDWYKGEHDIRDKELKKLFNKVLDKKVHLTVIVDACHSGSISRGIPVQRQYKAAFPETFVISEEPDSNLPPAERGALILSAARSFQEASEIFDEDTGTYHGLFTWALIRVLRSCIINESVENIMLRVDALMQSEGRYQRVRLHYPTTEAPLEFKKKPLFGEKLGVRSGIIAAVEKVRGDEVTLRAGYAAGIREKCQLKKICYNKQKPESLIRVTEVNGLNRCKAKVIGGIPEDIKVSDLFEIHKWVASKEARLNIWIPTFPYSVNVLTLTIHEIEKLKYMQDLVWVEDPTEKSPTHTLYWHKSYWCLETNKGQIFKIGKNPTTDVIQKKINTTQWEGKGKPRLFFQLPTNTKLNKAIRAEISDYNDTIKIVSSIKKAHYVLAGRISPRGIKYAWVLPNTTHEKEEGFALPIRSDWIALRSDEQKVREASEKMSDDLLRLVKIRAWLQLPSPPDSEKFPYRLFLKNTITCELKSKGPLDGGDVYGLILQADKEKLKAVKEKRFVYVFSIDNYGCSTLLFPKKTKMDSGNCFPQGIEWPTEITLGQKNLFKISSPFGMDTFILLTTVEPITNPDVLNFKGVRREATRGALRTPLEKLLYGIGAPVSRSDTVTPTNWSIQRLSVLSIEGRK